MVLTAFALGLHSSYGNSMEEFKRSHLHSSHTSFDPGGRKSSRELGFSSPPRNHSTVNHRHPSPSSRSSPSVTPAASSYTAKGSDSPHRRPISIDVSQPVRSFSGPLHPASFTPDAPTYTAYLHLSTVQSGAGISSEPVIIARHDACMRKGLAATHKSYKGLDPIESATLQRSFPWELELLNAVLTRVETRPRIGSRSNGFRVESKSYKTLLQILTARRRSARDGFRINGRKPLALPSWGDSFDLSEFYMLSDFELLAVCFRAEVEHFLIELRRFWSFSRRRPIIVPWESIPTRRGSSPSSSGTLESSDTRGALASPRSCENSLVASRHITDIPTQVYTGTELDNHLSNTTVVSRIVGVPSLLVPLSNCTSPPSLIPESRSQSSGFTVCASALVAQQESNISSTQPDLIESNTGPPASLTLNSLCETSHGGTDTPLSLSRCSESFGDRVGFLDKGDKIQYPIQGDSVASPATVTHGLAAGTIIPTAEFSALAPGRLGTAITSVRRTSDFGTHTPHTATMKARTFNLKVSDLCNRIV
ncbi:hypothetical protein DFH06DRAFT_1128091 [Mycena polygramma]|nr:hypothetical protein DFH06DRAFT_1128091 [Mycena polygramma]